MKTYPLLQAQLGVFMQCIQHPASTQYNLPSYTRIPSTIDIDRLANAWKKVLDERKELRTRFMIDQEGEIRQWSDDDMRIPVIRRKCTDAELRDYIDNGFVRPFDLLGGEPLFRVELVEAGKGVFVLTDGHHCVTDGMTFTPVITRIDLTSAYAGAELEPHGYGMYEAAEEEVTSFGTEIYERAKAYYAEKFAGMDFATISKSVHRTMGKMVRRSSFINRRLCDEWSKTNGTQVNLLFQAAFSHVISVLTRQEKVAYFTVNHGRMDKRLRHSIGMFVKSVPILVNAAGDTKVIDFIKSFRAEMMSTIRYGVYPFSHFCRDLRMTPGVSFNFQALPDMEEVAILGEERVYASQIIRSEVNDDMAIFIFFKGDNYEIRVESSCGMNDEVTLQMISDAMLATMKNMMADPDADLRDIPIVSPGEGKNLLALSQGEVLSYDRTETFIDLFQKQVALYPDSTAVVDEVSSITYAELDRQSNLLAHALIKSGVGTDTFVAVMLPRRKDFIVSVLAVFKAGGAYIPLDSDYPNDRLLYMLEDSTAKVLITTRTLLEEKCKEGDFKADNILFVDEFDFSGRCAPVNNSRPESLAYMIYTSGSTGQPKGVMVEHKGLMNFTKSLIDAECLTNNDRIACHRSFSFDAHIGDLYPILASGGEMHIMPSDIRKDLQMIYEFIVSHEITGTGFTTSLMMLLLNRYELPVRFLTAGGEKLYGVKSDKIRIINLYGPTECTNDSTLFVINPGEEYENIPIGRPLPNMSCFVIDAYGQLVAQGVAGELCIVGVQVGRGYWNRPELTAEKFIDCPFIEGEKMYRTGDLVRWNKDGELEYLGRIDSQVKLRGFRIELGEIESAMAKYEGIQSSVVEVKEINGTQHLCGYYTSEEAINEEELREYLSQTLTDYMVPTAFMRLEAMPLTPNGKVNRKALSMPEIKAEEIVVPETKLEQSLFKIVSKLLGTTSFGVTTNLISMGLTSMSAIKLSLAVQRELGLNLPTKEILQTPIIRTWTNIIGSEQEELTVYQRRDYYPLTENQLGVYIDWEQHREGLQYNVPQALKLTGIDSVLLKESLEKVLESHSYLKTRMAVIEGEVVQLRREEHPIEILLQALDAAPSEEFFQSRVLPFNLLEDDLCRIEIYTTVEHTYLFMDIHHIIYDGGSVAILMADLQRCYNGIAIENESFTAYDYSLYYADWKASESYSASEAYFDRLVAGAESVLYPISAKTVTDGGSEGLMVSIPRGSVTELCRKVGVTENCLFTTALTQVLHRITREEDLLITTISNGRSSAKMAESVGMFVQTLPVVSHMNHQTVFECLTDMQQQLLETISRDKYPFTRLVEHHGVKPNIMIVYQGEVVGDSFRIGGKETASLSLRLTTSKVPLSLTIVPDGEQYNLLLEYDGTLYSRLDMERLSQALESFIALVTVAPLDEKMESIPMVGDTEKESLIALGKGEELSYDRTETFIDLFQKQVALYPDSTAVVDEVSSITYAELDRQSDLLAHALVDSGVGTDSFVAVMLPRRKEFLVSVLAVFKAGGAYIPLDSDYPNDRLLYMLEDSAARVLITTKELLDEKCKEGDFTAENILFVDEFDFSSDCAPINNSHPESLAYMIYTSGSTGKPKGVMIEHKGLRNFVEWLAHLEDLKPRDRSAQIVSFSFDMSIYDLTTPLTTGGEIHILPSSLCKDMEGMYTYFKNNHIEGVTYSTQLGMEILNQYNLPIRFILIGGEKLLSTRPSSVIILNTYGPTEFSVCSSYHIVEQGREYNNIPIGRPVPNTFSAIVDALGNLVPRGVEGELCLIGRQIARGYWNRPELTAEKFIDCPFIEGEKMYRTGDLARWNENGELEYLGRIDSQVKLRGFRIELGEIESAMAKYEGIQSSVVEVKEINDTQHLCGYYTSEEAINEEELREYLSQTLTDYMVPTAFMRMETMPLTPNGKVNRKALPMPEIKAEEIIVPETKLEQSLFKIVSKLLGTTSFGVTTNLISMGLTSMSAIKLSLAVQRELGLNLPTKNILQKPVIRTWLELIGTEEEELPIYEKRDYYPLTENQLGIYIDWEQHREGLQYNVPIALRLTGADPALLKASLEKILEAHPYLKTRLGIRESEIVQFRHDHEQVDILVQTLDTEPNEEFFQSRLRPFNLLEENLYRIEIYAFEDYTYLFMDIHHILYDGGSVSILMDDLQKCYNGIEIEPELFTAYDYSLYYADWKGSEAYLDSESYFDRLVAGTESVLYPVSGETKADSGSEELTISLPRGSVTELCRKVGVTENCLFTTALTQVLHRITREEDLLITTISNGRSSAKMAESVGMFVQTLPVVSHMNHQTVFECLTDMQQQLLETISRDKYPFTRLVEHHGVKPNIMIVYQGEVVGDSFRIGGKETASLSLRLTTSKVPLSLTIVPDGEQYNLLLEYDGTLYSRLDMERLSQALESFIALVTVAPLDEKMESIPMVGDTEKESLIALGKGEELSYDRTETFIDLFQKQVALYPDSTAVVDEVSSITYAELDRQSNLLAHALIKSGVGTDTFVAVMLPRRKDFIVSVLAVFKAGGAYIPLDSDYPNDRLLYMLEDSAARVLITTKELLDEKCKEGDFTAENILFVDEFDFSSDCAPINNSHPESLAYMIYTSGSTGKPKGVMMEHKGLYVLMQWLVPMEELKAGDCCIEHSSFSFDASLFDLYPPLSMGGVVHILGSSLRQDIEGLYKYIVQQNIVGATFSTQLGMELLNQYDLPLHYMVMGGEKLKPTRPSSVKVINGYGPTEFSVCSSYHIVEQGREYNNIPIGCPVPNTMSAIVDGADNLVPRGVEGELCLIGRQIARGYWNRPDLTAEKFIDCPFIEGEKMYRTGDLARWNEDGELEYLGRIDSQVKLRGFRIELGEIESAMAKYEAIQSSVVEVKEINGTQHLCGYYTSEEAINEEGLRAYLSQTLTDYMVPTAFMRLEAMPLTSNGKVDRKVLPVPALSSMIKNVPPCHEVEEKMLEIARELLPGIEFGVTDDLFSLGMTSLQAMKFSSRIKPLHLDIRVSILMRDRNIRAILDGNIRLFWFHDNYDKSKQTLVFVSGIVPIKSTLEKFELWGKDFNIFIIEPIDSHYQKLFKGANFEEVIWMYSTFIEQNMPEDAYVFGFMGLSWGGKLAYYLAQRWNEVKGQLSAVIMGDCAFHFPTAGIDKAVRDAAIRVQLDGYKDVSLAEVLIYMLDCVFRVESAKEMPKPKPYSGHVLYFNSIKDGLTPSKQENLSMIRELATDLDIVDIPNCNHEEIITDQSLNTLYREYLCNIINKQR